MWYQHVYVLFGTLLSIPLHNALDLKYVRKNLNWRIIGGEDAPEGLYTYQASLRIKNSGLRIATETHCRHNFKALGSKVMYHYGYHTCGASIISPDYVLTAAHCVAHKNPETLLVVVGSATLDRGGDAYAISEIHWNGNFSLWHGRDDIALVKVSPSIEFSSSVNFVALEDNEVGCPEQVTLSGWGFVERSDNLVCNNLQHIQLQTLEVNACKDKHEKTVTENQICTTNESGAGACKGDSGGPLVKIYESNMIKQVGIVSFNDACKAGSPDVYTKVSKYLSWIREKCNNCV